MLGRAGGMGVVVDGCSCAITKCILCWFIVVILLAMVMVKGMRDRRLGLDCVNKT